ncbi:MAG: MATE family efflux transporter, partial [SAR324 cluster bacterium]|nr:MATE family efflux transporter [SAR324 cluster bacterium]
MPKSGSFTQGEINHLLTHKTLAMLIGIMGMVAFNLTDTYFISLLGTRELAAISFTFPVVMSIMALTMGIGVGSSTVVSKALGRGDQSAVKRLTTDSLILAFFIVLIFTSLGLYFMEGTFALMGANDDLKPIIFDYMTIWFYGMPFLVIPMVGNNAIRATGAMKKASMIMIVAMSINLILDPLLIFGLGPFPRMEVQGAALATLIARAVTLFLSLYVLTFQEDMITWVRPKFTQLLASFKEILFIALPMGATNLILPLGMGVITKLVASYGPSAVAA